MADKTKVFQPTILKQLREDKGFTLKELSDVAGISVNQLFSLEKGLATTPRSKTIKKLSEALGVNQEYFYGITNPVEVNPIDHFPTSVQEFLSNKENKDVIIGIVSYLIK